MKSSTTVVITVEGLSAAALSCYGSSWNETPQLDAIAADGCVWSHVVAASTDPLSVFASWVGTGTAPWWAAVRGEGSVELFTDDARLTKLDFLSGFDRVELVAEKTIRVRTRPRDHVDQTRAGRLFAAALDRMDQSDRPRLIWIHCSSLVKCWDAPRYLALVDDTPDEDTEPNDDVELIELESEEQPSPLAPASVFDSIEPPDFQLEPDCHPDLAMSWMRTYGCQVRLLDLLIGLVRGYEPLAGADLMVAGTSGFALGENGWVGANCPRVRSSLIRTPLLMSRPKSLRVPQLISSDEVPALMAKLADNTSPVVTSAQWAHRQTELEPCISTVSRDGAIFITTPSWFFVEETTGEQFLYLKPDDIGDVNDISRLRGDVVQTLRAQASEIAASSQSIQ